MHAPRSQPNGRPAPVYGRPWWPRAATDREKVLETVKELRRFAVVVSLPLVLIGGFLVWRGPSVGMGLLAAAAILLLLAGLSPRALAPIERLWMKLAMALSVVMTYVILTLTFFLVITPVGLLVRNLGRGGLALRFERDRASYWDPVEKDGPGTRPDRPY